MKTRYTRADDEWVDLVEAVCGGEVYPDGRRLYEWEGRMVFSDVNFDRAGNIVDNAIDVWPAKRLERVTVEWVRA